MKKECIHARHNWNVATISMRGRVWLINGGRGGGRRIYSSHAPSEYCLPLCLLVKGEGPALLTGYKALATNIFI
jgi:hypothetical protein